MTNIIEFPTMNPYYLTCMEQIEAAFIKLEGGIPLDKREKTIVRFFEIVPDDKKELKAYCKYQEENKKVEDDEQEHQGFWRAIYWYKLRLLKNSSSRRMVAVR